MMGNEKYKLVRSRHFRRLTFSISPKGIIRVSAPYHLSLKKIKRYLAEFEEKIAGEDHSQGFIICDQDIREDKIICYPFLDGALNIKTQFITVQKAYTSNGADFLEIHIPGANQDLKMETWMALVKNYYKQKARIFFKEQSDIFANQLGTTYLKLRIGDQSSRWGSCSGRKTLSFNLRLMLAPQKVAEYVALHEVAHLIEANHSRKFWAIVDKHYPEYKEAKQWLKNNGKELWKYF